MNALFRGITVGAALVALAACTTVDSAKNSLNNAKATAASSEASAFDSALRDEYLALATWDFEGYGDFVTDPESVIAYSEKATAAANGTSPLPVDPANPPFKQKIGAANIVADMNDARSTLLCLLDAGGRDVAPAVSAKGQASYDCLVEQLGEGTCYQPADRDKCGEDLEAAIDQLQDALKANVADTAYRIYFDLDRPKTRPYELRADEQGKIAEIVDFLGSVDNPSITLVGKTDTLASGDYNKRLAAKRVEAVRNALTEAGVDPSIISGVVHGEEFRDKPIADETNEQENRRTEVLINYSGTPGAVPGASADISGCGDWDWSSDKYGVCN